MVGPYSEDGVVVDFFIPKYRRNPNAKVHSLYAGVTHGNRTVTTLIKPAPDGNRMEATRAYGDMLPRGEGGQIAVLVLGGMETTLDEMEYILEAKHQRKFVPERDGKEIAAMCRMLLERRNDLVRHYRKNPSERPRKREVRLHLPVGYRFMQTDTPGLKVLARI